MISDKDYQRTAFLIVMNSYPHVYLACHIFLSRSPRQIKIHTQISTVTSLLISQSAKTGEVQRVQSPRFADATRISPSRISPLPGKFDYIAEEEIANEFASFDFSPHYCGPGTSSS